jgi:adenine-specific DNA-methyltransferase
MGNKLELTWYGKEEQVKIEPRLLIHDSSKDYGDADSENMLIHGDNLLALKALEKDFTGKIKCIYIDPPYNTGSAFEHYDDNLEHSIWLGLMKQRLVMLRKLLSPEGTIWIQIDDEEQAYLKVICDEVFGRSNFINMLSVNMKNIAGASGGGEDKRLKKNCEYILVYAKEYSLLPLFNGPYVYTEMSELIQQYIDEGKSWKYTTVLLNPGEKEYIGSTVDGDGNEIKVFTRRNPEMMSIKQVAKRDGITERMRSHPLEQG